ncbi:BREX-2 system phosphatase PglZ [Streptomyces sp. OM5714]|uniref:BREX-2 system phosphatase PglZ n=1 Tax=Streptomyces sp. OM5714 TaxID=2602736 RepID=UPI0013D90E21|nr:BREX-2 system phosphatase PglZ [Streptomyces sp. OM5714]KAF2776806.1 bacteriophage resistance gene PglZ [Streptomyces sp. OM5714]
MALLPQVGRRTVEALLDRHAKKLAEHSLMLVHGQYAAGSATTFTAEVGERTRRVTVRDESSVLGVLAAWHSHRDEAAPGDLLVVTTGLDDDQLGWDVRGHAVHRRTLNVEQAEIVTQRFGATGLDVRMYREDWLLQALVDAEPAGRGWPRTAGTLTRDAALRALVVERLGLDHPDISPHAPAEAAVDADVLLAWSRTPAGPRRFAELGDTERAELKKWLGEVAGPAVPVLLALAEIGRGHDAMALGLLGAALRDPAADPDVALAVGGLFGKAGPRRGEIGAFTDAVEGTLLRWIGEAAGSVDARHKVFAVLQRADDLARDAGLASGLNGSRFLLSSFAAQLAAVVEGAHRSPEQGESALAELTGHALAGLFPDRVRVAEMAVRLARWLRQGPPALTSVATGVRGHVAEWGWVDRALAVLWAGDPGGDPSVARSLRDLYEDGRVQRERLDEQFARHLAGWAPNATAQQPGGCLVVENVLDTVVRPLTTGGAPLVIVLDGMSSAVAAQLGEEAEREGWQEIVPRPGEGGRRTRLAAVSMLPSITRTSRASLLSGTAAQGGQSTEASGFAAFWRKRRKDAALFHKASIGGDAGHFLAQELASALASDAVVGVVLNTIDDALDSGQQGQRTVWSLGDITYLRELLAAARSYARPVVLVADHGHVIDRGRGRVTPAADGGGSARWRPDTDAGDGEVVLSGPRVLEGGGTVTVPWHEDIRYAARRAGYHGGASLAEVTVPVLVLLPSKELAPRDWEPLPREQAAPSWWKATAATPAEVPEARAESAAQPVRRPAKPARRQDEELFGTDDVVMPEGAPAATPAPATLGGRVVTSEVYEAQKEYVRKAPEGKVVAAVIDALAAAGGTMSPAALAAAISATGRVRRNIEGFVATVQRLLNVEGYPVLGFVDAGHAVKLDVALLRDQFLADGARTGSARKETS